MSRRARIGFVAACLLVFALLAAVLTWTAPDDPPGAPPASVTQGPGADRPAGLAVADLRDTSQLQARFNDDQGVPRLVLALAPT
jgi:hypothetical protein